MFNRPCGEDEDPKMYAIDRITGQTVQENSQLSVKAKSIKNNASHHHQNSSKFTGGSKSVRSSQASNKNGQQIQISKQMSDGQRRDLKNLQKLNQNLEVKESKQTKKINNIQHLINQSKNKRLLEMKLKSSVVPQQAHGTDQGNTQDAVSAANQAEENKNIQQRKVSINDENNEM